MLTRAQVAKRLGKSIATVRRLEGERLHPRRDAAGIHRFDAGEVARLASQLAIERGGRATSAGAGDSPQRTASCKSRSGWLLPPSPSRSRVGDRDQDTGVASLEPEAASPEPGEIARLAERVRHLETVLPERERPPDRTRHESDHLQHLELAQNVIEELTSLSDRQLRSVDPSLPRLLDWLLKY